MSTAQTRRVFPKGDPLLTYEQAAERAACSPSTIRRLVRAEALPVVRLRANVVRVPQSALDAYIQSCLSGGEQ